MLPLLPNLLWCNHGTLLAKSPIHKFWVQCLFILQQLPFTRSILTRSIAMRSTLNLSRWLSCIFLIPSTVGVTTTSCRLFGERCSPLVTRKNTDLKTVHWRSLSRRNCILSANIHAASLAGHTARSTHYGLHRWSCNILWSNVGIWQLQTVTMEVLWLWGATNK